MTYGIALFPSEDISEVANELRKRYDPRYDFIAPHITLKEAFNIEKDTFPEITASLKQIAEQTKPFEIEINKVSTFAPVTNTIYFKVEQNDSLLSLYEQFHTDSFPGESAYNFVPHITVAQELAEDEISDIYGTLKLKNVQFKDHIESFHLCKQASDGTWSIVETFALKGE